ncbi:Zinc finger MYM-type protein 1-like [Oopsacas minuta]|uniref:Zinc finger MYM-type protein 1-like n=1 Tax=Oopsacas minuta TaxID=111878 RepID=A0AAV7JIP3_9METZ|nr:Zinc finger MYM-type protein 1-like [Oopsacas minuta]
MTPGLSVAQEMPSENSIEIDLGQTSGLLDEEITITKDTMADENEERHIDENIPATQNDVEISLKRHYCQTCWLFADRSNARLQWSRINGITGSSRHLCEKIRIHETCDIHISATAVLHRWKGGERLDQSLEIGFRNEVNYWRKILHRIVNIIHTLASLSLPFRAHNTTSDITKTDQVTIIIMLLDISNEFPIVKETFIGFIFITDASTSGLLKVVLNSISEFGLDIKKIRGQGYDGASVMSGPKGGVQN